MTAALIMPSSAYRQIRLRAQLQLGAAAESVGKSRTAASAVRRIPFRMLCVLGIRCALEGGTGSFFLNTKAL